MKKYSGTNIIQLHNSPKTQRNEGQILSTTIIQVKDARKTKQQNKQGYQKTQPKQL